MNFILFILRGVCEVFGAMVGLGVSDQNAAGAGIGVLVVVVAIYWLICFLLLKTKLRGVWAALLSLIILFAIIGILAGICVLVENAVVA